MIDDFGGLETALNYTLEKIERDESDVKIHVYPKDPNEDFAKLVRNLEKWGGEDALLQLKPQQQNSEFWEYYQDLNTLMNQYPYQARMPYIKILD